MRIPSPVTLLLAALLAAGCPQTRLECEKAADCGGTSASPCDTCPASASEYCNGGKCESAASKDLDLKLNITARNQSIQSIRFVVVWQTSAKQIGQCAGQPNCTGDAITCEDLKDADWSDARFNVVLSGARNASTAGGVDVFPDFPVGNVPSSRHLLALEGRSGSLGNGDRVSFVCQPITTSLMSLTLTAQ
jgi:hypothetical protein